MVRYASLLSQLLTVFDRTRFYGLVHRHQAERYATQRSRMPTWMRSRVEYREFGRLGNWYRKLNERLPNLSVFGGVLWDESAAC